MGFWDLGFLTIVGGLEIGAKGKCMYVRSKLM